MKSSKAAWLQIWGLLGLGLISVTAALVLTFVGDEEGNINTTILLLFGILSIITANISLNILARVEELGKARDDQEEAEDEVNME